MYEIEFSLDSLDQSDTQTKSLFGLVSKTDRSHFKVKRLSQGHPIQHKELCDSKKGVINPKDTAHIAVDWFRVLQPMVIRALWPMTASVILKQNHLNF